MIQKILKKSDHPRRGQSLVEVALVLPIIIMILLGLLDFGRAFYTMVALRDAADEGASYAAIKPNDTVGIQRRAAEASTNLVSIAIGDVSIIRPTPLAVGQPITVTVDFYFDLYTPFVQGLLPGGELILQGRATHAILSLQ